MPYQSSVTSVHWMPDGQKFLTAGQDGLVKVGISAHVGEIILVGLGQLGKYDEDATRARMLGD